MDTFRSHVHTFANFLWEFWCIISVVGIWPRFIEPRLLATTRLNIDIPSLPEDLRGLKIVQFSDLHLHPSMPDSFLKKLQKKLISLKPDLLFFTGDFLCYANIHEETRLKNFLNSLKAQYGCFAILGNHDYQSFVSINSQGEYDQVEMNQPQLYKGFSRLFKTISLRKYVTERAKTIPLNQSLVNLIRETPFKLLHNSTEQVSIRTSYVNICGLGEYMLGRFLPSEAFKNYDIKYPGIILTHNPDSAPQLKQYPGELILSGHTHGGQVNLPKLWQKFTLLENMQFKKGLFRLDKKWLYVNRGVGSAFNFRWFSVPEILFATLG